MMGRIRSSTGFGEHSRAAALGCALLLIAPLPASARGRARPVRITVPAGPAGEAITRLAVEGDLQILFSPELVAHCRVAGFSGREAPRRLLERMIRPCGLSQHILPDGTILLRRSAAPPEPPPMPGRPSGDVLVTALKRETYLDATAASMSVRQGFDIERREEMGPRAAAASLPGLDALDSGTGMARLTVRGVYGVGEPTVAVYYDETPITGPAGTTLDPGVGAPDLELVDIDRAELLRGPQGTLYGAGSMGGMLHVLFNKPDLSHLSGSLRAGLIATDRGGMAETASAVLNLPLVTDRLAVRAVAYRRASPGYIYDDMLRETIGGRVERTGARLSATFAATPDFTITGLFTWQRLHADDSAYWYEGDGLYRNGQKVVAPYDSRIMLGNLTARLNLGGMALVATASHYGWRQVRSSDYTAVIAGQRASAAGCLRYAGDGGGGDCTAAQMAAYGDYVDSRLPAVLWQPMRVEGSSAELRLVSSGRRVLDWTLGLFAERRHDAVDSYALHVDAQTGRVMQPYDITGYRRITQTLNQIAIFGEAGWHITRQVTLTAGGRYFDYHRTGHGTVPIANLITGTSDLETSDRRTHEEGKSLKFELAWQALPSLLTYLQAAQGFRPGGVNITPGLTREEQYYRSDHLWSYEFGIKLQRREWAGATLDAGVFHDWSNMIASVTSESGAFQYNANIGSVDIDGGELQGSLAPWRGGMLTAAVTALDARLVHDQQIPSAAGQARRGDDVPNVPRVSVSARASQQVRMASGDSVNIDGALSYRSGFASQFNAGMSDYERTPSHLTVDLALGWQHREWNIVLLIDNLFDAVAATRIVSDFSGDRRVYSSGPRTIGLSMRRSF
ncbi:TonB-dependent receptor [Sphingomonas sp.]|uniref:TonB-dependent receptor n=1 Tax=Sphingomonas sp. TaxID=28214 RepID=UPI0035AED9FF